MAGESAVRLDARWFPFLEALSMWNCSLAVVDARAIRRRYVVNTTLGPI